MTKYEYETEGFAPYSGKSLTEWLNERGAEGWQVVSFERTAPTPGYDATLYRVVWMKRSDIGEPSK